MTRPQFPPPSKRIHIRIFHRPRALKPRSVSSSTRTGAPGILMTCLLELIDNGGFESDVLGAKWKFWGSRYSSIAAATVSKSEFSSGQSACKSQYLDVDSNEYLTQTFDVQGNTQYAIEFFLFVNGGDARSTVTLMAHWKRFLVIILLFGLIFLVL